MHHNSCRYEDFLASLVLKTKSYVRCETTYPIVMKLYVLKRV